MSKTESDRGRVLLTTIDPPNEPMSGLLYDTRNAHAWVQSSVTIALDETR